MGTPTLPAPFPALGTLGRLNVARLRLPLGLGLAVAAVWALELSPVWAGVRASLAALDFDPTRAALISAWAACFAVALLAGLLTARSWPSGLAAVAFLAFTFVVPWAWHAVSERPALFGSPQLVDAGALLRSLAVMLAVGFVAAVPAAATGRLLGESLSGLDRRQALPLSALGASLLIVVLGAASLIRYGPGHGVYRPAAGSHVAYPGHTLIRTFHSAAMNADRPYAVYLPPSYDTSSARRYPTVYLLHGDPGSYVDWLNLGAPQVFDRGIAARALPEAVVVMPDGSGRAGRATQWADSLDGRDRVESSVLELVTTVDGDYRTLPDPRHRVVAGLSEGGFGAANLAARHPELFGTAVSLSGYFRAEGAVFGTDPALLRANSPSSLVQDRPDARSVDFVLVAGRDDQRYLQKARKFSAELDSLGVRHQLLELPGGHESQVWTNGLIAGLEHVKPQLAEKVR